jgi:hypothetical protein
LVVWPADLRDLRDANFPFFCFSNVVIKPLLAISLPLE